MVTAKFQVEDLFDLVDEGTAITGNVVEGELNTNMKLSLPAGSVEILRIDAGGGQVDGLTPEQSSGYNPSPGVVVKSITKKELNDVGVLRGSEIQFVLED